MLFALGVEDMSCVLSDPSVLDQITANDMDMSTEATLKASMAALQVIKSGPEANKLVGDLYPAHNYKMPGDSIIVSSELESIISAAKLKSCDLSSELHPHLTISDMAEWTVRKNELVHKNPDTVFYVTCDTVSTIEAIKYLDAEVKAGALLALVEFKGDAHGFAWRGEDYVRIASLGHVTTLQGLKETMKALTQPNGECSICLEQFDEVRRNVVQLGVMTRTPFTCMHSICTECYDQNLDPKSGDFILKSCPICRSTDGLQVAIKKRHASDNSSGSKSSGKKKARANGRRGR